MTKSSRTFASRFIMVQDRATGALGVLDEVPPNGNDVRQFRIIWEAGSNSMIWRETYTPKELLTNTIAVNGHAKKLVLELMTTSWWAENTADGEHR